MPLGACANVVTANAIANTTALRKNETLILDENIAVVAVDKL